MKTLKLLTKQGVGFALIPPFCVVSQMLTYGAEREVILKATDADGSCVLACALAAVHLLTQKKPDFETNSFLFAANKNLVFSFVPVWFEWFSLVSLLNGE